MDTKSPILKFFITP